MSQEHAYPDLEGWEATRDTLSLYAKAIGAVPRALSEPHPKWWHISLKVRPEGLVTDPIPHPAQKERTFQLLLNLHAHQLQMITREAVAPIIEFDAELTAGEFGESLLGALSKWGVSAAFDGARLEDDSPRVYDRTFAERYLQALVGIDSVLKIHKLGLGGETGPVQLWPHHFDLAFEWFGTKMVTQQEDRHATDYPSQINFGFSPGDSSHPAPYFYSNPWPFDESLQGRALPAGAQWVSESWQGSLMPYAEIIHHPAGSDKLLAYYRAVYEAASPALLE